MSINLKALLLALVWLGAASAHAETAERARFQYQLFCQGCHTPTGKGGQGVPAFTDFIGTFVSSDKGRAFLVRVPGSANAPLNDRELADVLNWIVDRFAGRSEPEQWKRFTEQEIESYRGDPLTRVNQYRTKLLEELSAINEG